MVGIGFVHNTMITDGVIIVIPHLGIEEYLMIGEIVTEIIGGVVVLGIIMAANLGVMAVGVNPVVTAADPVVERVVMVVFLPVVDIPAVETVFIDKIQGTHHTDRLVLVKSWNEGSMTHGVILKNIYCF